MDHDQRFKELLREFWWELLLLFLPWLAQRLALRNIDWQPQEVFTNPPLGLVRRVDLLALLRERIDSDHTRERVLHLEVESARSLTEVRNKLGYYYPGLRTKHNLPVTTLAVYLHVGLQGQGWDTYEEANNEESIYRVRWRYVGLPALRAEEYLGGDNWLGVALASLMRIDEDRQAWLRAEILRRLAIECQENDYRKLLLINCVETYLPLEGEQEEEYLRLIRYDPRYQETERMIRTTYDRGVAEGKIEGKIEALREMVIRLARRQCGSPDEGVLMRLQGIEDISRLETLVEAATTVTSWERLFTTQ
jgi:hypothetical protein